MIRRRIVPLLFALIPVSIFPANGQELSLRINLYDEQVYFPDSEIQIHVTLENDSPRAATFQLATERLFNVEFEVRTAENETLPPSDQFTIARNRDQVFYRTVTLEPGERLSFVEPLATYVAIPASGMYTVQARFYSGLQRYDVGAAIHSNPISLHVRPGTTPVIRREQRVATIVEERLRREDLSPDQVVSYTLSALQSQNWERFFLYLNLERLYRSVPTRNNSYIRLSEQEQLDTLSSYRRELEDRASGNAEQLVIVPDEFEILQTSYTPTSGTVRVMMYFDMRTFRERREYVYDLERRNGYWEIVDYTVMSLSNEALPQ